MPLREKEIIEITRATVETIVHNLLGIAPEIEKRTKQNALNLFENVEYSVRQNGYRITPRVRAIIFKTLTNIMDRQLAPSHITRTDITAMAMRTNENKHPVIVMEGHRMRWTRTGWVNEGVATPHDKIAYPMVVDKL